MLKKVLFFSITIILGLILTYTVYYSFYINHIYAIVETAIQEERYDDVARMFTSYFDSKSVITNSATDEEIIFVYPSIVSIEKKGTDDVVYSSFEKGYSFYTFKLETDEFSDVTIKDKETKNESQMIFYHGETSHSYPFVVTEGDAPYNLTETISNLKCVEVHMGEKEINSKLGGKITSFSLNGNENQTIYTKDINLDFSEEFFAVADEFINTYDECTLAKDEETFQTFYDKWLEEYKATEDYRIFYAEKEIKPASLIWKTVGIMAIYVFVCVLLGLLIFKGGKLFARRGNADTRFRNKTPMKGNITKRDVEPVKKPEITETVIEAEITPVLDEEVESNDNE